MRESARISIDPDTLHGEERIAIESGATRLTPLLAAGLAPLLAASLAVFLAAATAGCIHVSHGRKVDLGGYGLRIYCSGEGAPAVVLEAGLGDSSATWSEVQPDVAAFTRVCAYDRAGLGRSDPGPAPRTSQRIVDELHDLLLRSGVAPPYVLVGHSFGGLNVRLFASEHPTECVGMVLVEATHEDYPLREKVIRSPEEKSNMENRFAIGPPAALGEYQSIEESARQVRAAGPPPDVPVVVITAGRREDSPQMQKVWRELQADLARRWPRGTHLIAEKSGHYVQFDQPKLVVDAIQQVVDSARGK